MSLVRKTQFPLAFGFTAAAVWFAVAGAIGYDASRPLSGQNHWMGAPIWWEIGLGITCAVAAAVYWRKALHSISK